MIRKNFAQQYSKKITHLSQQGYGKKKIQRLRSKRKTKKKT